MELDKEVQEALQNASQEQENTLRFSNGKAITNEQLEALDPAVRDVILAFKETDSSFSKGIQQSSKRISELEAQLAAANKPDANKEKQEQEQAQAAQFKLPDGMDDYLKFGHRQMAEKKFNEARSNAMALYGQKATDIIGLKLSTILRKWVEGGEYQKNFRGAFTNAFAELISNDQELFDAYTEFKTGKAPKNEELEKKRLQEIEAAKLKQQAHGGLPAGGATNTFSTKEEVVNSREEALKKLRADWK